MNHKKYYMHYALSISLLLIPQANLAEGKRIIKWVDSKGVTHYGDTLPPQQAGKKNNAQMRHNGVVEKKAAPAINDEKKQQNDDKLLQQRKDHVLLSSYTNAEEIDLARDRNLELANSTLQAIKAQKTNVTERIKRYEKEISAFKERKKTPPAALSKSIKSSHSKLKRLGALITKQNLNIEAIKKRFAEEKARFIILKETK